jgi:hypothetical protein
MYMKTAGLVDLGPGTYGVKISDLKISEMTNGNIIDCVIEVSDLGKASDPDKYDKILVVHEPPLTLSMLKGSAVGSLVSTKSGSRTIAIKISSGMWAVTGLSMLITSEELTRMIGPVFAMKND